MGTWASSKEEGRALCALEGGEREPQTLTVRWEHHHLLPCPCARERGACFILKDFAGKQIIFSHYECTQSQIWVSVFLWCLNLVRNMYFNRM